MGVNFGMKEIIREIVLLVLCLILLVLALLASCGVIDRRASPLLYVTIALSILGCILRLRENHKKGKK